MMASHPVTDSSPAMATPYSVMQIQNQSQGGADCG